MESLERKEAIAELQAMREHIVPYMSVVGIDAYDMAVLALVRAVPCQECEHAWHRPHVPEAPYFCLIDGHFHKGDFFCRNGKPKVDET